MSSESAPTSSMNEVLRVDLFLVDAQVLADDLDHALFDGRHGAILPAPRGRDGGAGGRLP